MIITSKIYQYIESLNTKPESSMCYYLYDLDIVKKQIQKLQEFLPPQVRIYYSMKANPHSKILSLIHKHKFIQGIEVASVGEMKECLKFFTGSQILSTGPAKTKEELIFAIDNELRQIHVESLTEVERLEHGILNATQKAIDILVRLNPKYNFKKGSYVVGTEYSKFGVDEEYLSTMYQKIQTCKHLNFRGVHLFGATQILDADIFIEFARYCFEFVRKQEPEIRMECIDLGGGFGLDYHSENKELDLAKVGQGLQQLITKFQFQDKEIILELGRFLVGDCGYYIAPIIDIKKSNGKKIIMISGGSHHLVRPVDEKLNHPTTILPGRKLPYLKSAMKVEKEVIDIAGVLCSPRDFLAKNLFVEHAEIGDYVVIGIAGAYGFTSSPSEFLNHPKPLELFC